MATGNCVTSSKFKGGVKKNRFSADICVCFCRERVYINGKSLDWTQVLNDR
jgi:hypothetical protein